MAQSFTQVAPDSTGDKMHTRTYTVGADVVSDQYVTPVSQRTRLGLYRGVTALNATAAAADAATAGRWWLINPAGSSVAVAVKRVLIAWTATGAAAAAATGPRITLERFTATGAPSGAALTPSKRVRTAVAGLAVDATPVASVRTASTGLTISAGELAHAWAAPYMGGTAWVLDTYSSTDVGLEDDETILAAGEGIVCRQADAAAADIRRWVNTIVWEEFTAP